MGEIGGMSPHASKDAFARVRRALRLDELSPGVRKVLVGFVGGCVLLAGLALLFLPGPAFIVIPLGLAILATEFAWARYYLRKARGWLDRCRAQFRRRRENRRSEEVPVK